MAEDEKEEAPDQTDVASVFVDDETEKSQEESDESQGDKSEDDSQKEKSEQAEESGKEDTGTDDKAKSGTPPDADKRIAGLEAGIASERDKRQKAESEARALREQLQGAKKLPDPVDDPEGFQRELDKRNAANVLNTKIALSADMMRSAHEDYEEMEKVFYSLVVDGEGADARVIDPTLHQKFLAAPNPARFAYETAKDHLQTKKLKDPKHLEGLKAEWLKEERAKWEKEQKEKASGGKSATDLPDLTTATASGSNARRKEKSVDTLDDVFDDVED